MKHQKRFRRGRAHAAPAEVLFEQALMGEGDDGMRSFDPREDRKTLQLCRQVERALMLALAGECHDDLLRDAMVESVEPMGSASQLLVHVSLPSTANVLEVMSRLDHHSAHLRAIVAQSIHRKRAPMLSFVIVPAGGNHGQ